MFSKIKSKITKLFNKQRNNVEKFETIHSKLEHKRILLDGKEDDESLKEKIVLENLMIRTKKLIIKYK
ncbi:MAG: hypothetical protein U9Q33_04755 [Campylobacterota bacterium]|nr:hypothetical protein [Campylobacterota bacterium]